MDGEKQVMASKADSEALPLPSSTQDRTASRRKGLTKVLLVLAIGGFLWHSDLLWSSPITPGSSGLDSRHGDCDASDYLRGIEDKGGKASLWGLMEYNGVENKHGKHGHDHGKHGHHDHHGHHGHPHHGPHHPKIIFPKMAEKIFLEVPSNESVRA